jgi:protein-S-isoprenylcysteine O-methyltransferase Ste14
MLGGALLVYFFIPERLAWASLPFPAWLRWTGFGLGVLAVMATWWTEASLGLNFNVTLHLREGHTLVTHGPYRWVCHPMYTSLLGVTISWLLLSANWVVGLPGLAGLLTIVANRSSPVLAALRVKPL